MQLTIYKNKPKMNYISVPFWQHYQVKNAMAKIIYTKSKDVKQNKLIKTQK